MRTKIASYSRRSNVPFKQLQQFILLQSNITLSPSHLLPSLPLPLYPIHLTPIQHDTSNHSARNNSNYPRSTEYPPQSDQKTNTQYNAAHTQYYSKYYWHDIYRDSSRDWNLTAVRWFRCRDLGLRCSPGCRRWGSRLRRLGLS